MNKKKIEELLEKYWLCETTIAEEEELRIYFTQSEIPGHLLKYKALFGLKEEEIKVSLDESFDEKILGIIENDIAKKGRKFLLRPVLQIAASIAVVFGLGFSIHLYNQQQDQDPWKQDTYQAPEQALAEVQKVLSVVSIQMERSQEIVLKKIEKTEALTNIIKK